ncbi:hypothetical protein ACODT5_03500 [Streptomyces sp. 5.8]|uniref:hypothetical protein n=1 Tax=Streptomyces sp. 5.8 TaxID=3406571 RepID=UPI003BB6489F
MSALRTALTEPDRPKDLQIRFATLGGSYVDVTGPGPNYASGVHRWKCHGCADHSALPEEDYLHPIRARANTHAGLCRAIPLT